MRPRATHTSRSELAAPSESYRFVARQRSRPFIQGALVAMLVLAAVSTYLALTDVGDSRVWIVGAAASVLVAVVLLTVLQTRIPQVVTIRNSIIEIRRSGQTERFDLVDPTVEVLGRDGEIAFRCYDGRFAVVKARDVDWRVFTDVVMHYQNHADVKAEERKSRFRR
jgi:hypothetical protein